MRLTSLGLTLVALACGTAHAASTNFVGAAAAVVPEYEGSDEYRVLPVPLINYHQGGFFVTPRAGLPAAGVRTSLSEDIDAGVFVGLGLGRKASRTDRTRGLDNIDTHAALGAYLEWRPGPFSFGAAYKQAAHKGYGGALELRASYAVWQSGADSVRVGVGTEWMNRRAMQTWFGVSSSQAASSAYGLRTYDTSSGFKSVSAFATWNHRINADWSAVTAVGVNRLVGDAADSPLTARKVNAFGSAGVVYTF